VISRTRVAVALGSNVGDREAHLEFAVRRLSEILTNLRHSAWYDTAPVGVSPDHARYLNGAVVGETTLSAHALLDQLLALEGERGRTRPSAMAPRTLDLDLILYGNAVIREPGLEVPHPRFRERLFVLEPLAEIAPDWIDPETGEPVSVLRQRAPAGAS
jgi:2-amino-4-hydroxy-6-hydroxymethyldihydropteridine diphosphokinase